MFQSNHKNVYPVNPNFTILKWAVKGSTLHGHINMMYCRNETFGNKLENPNTAQVLTFWRLKIRYNHFLNWEKLLYFREMASKDADRMCRPRPRGPLA